MGGGEAVEPSPAAAAAAPFPESSKLVPTTAIIPSGSGKEQRKMDRGGFGVGFGSEQPMTTAAGRGCCEKDVEGGIWVAHETRHVDDGLLKVRDGMLSKFSRSRSSRWLFIMSAYRKNDLPPGNRRWNVSRILNNRPVFMTCNSVMWW